MWRSNVLMPVEPEEKETGTVTEAPAAPDAEPTEIVCGLARCVSREKHRQCQSK